MFWYGFAVGALAGLVCPALIRLLADAADHRGETVDVLSADRRRRMYRE